MPGKELISAVIISYNEEDRIASCINSLEKVVDEVILVDSFSTDATAEIAQKCGALVFRKKWMGYSATKNWGQEQAKFPFVLFIDADEALSAELAASIQQVKEVGLAGGYSFNRRNNYCGRWMRYGGLYPDCKPRLFGKNQARWQGEIHETLEYEVPITHLSGDLLHYSISDKQDHVKREKKYAKLSKPYRTKIHAGASAIFRFFKSYVLQLGFLEGRLGFQYAWISAKAKFWRD